MPSSAPMPKLFRFLASAIACGTPCIAPAAGLTTHVFMADRAVTHVDGGTHPVLRQLLDNNRNLVLSGAYFPDSGYVPTLSYGEYAHWDHFIQGYQRYISDQCGDELPFTAQSDLQSRCARLTAHMLGAAAHGIGDETWDFLFETIAAEIDLGGSKGNANGASDNIPQDVRDFVADLKLAPAAFVEECRRQYPNNGPVPADTFCEGNVGALYRTLHGMDPSANIEFNMDIASITRFDRYADMPLSEDLRSDTLSDEARLAGDRLLNAFAAQNPAMTSPVTLPPYAELATILTDERYIEQAMQPTYGDMQGDLVIGTQFMNGVGLVERVLAPYDSQRIRAEQPWAWENFYANSGGVVASARAIAGYWRGLFGRLQGSYTHPSIVSVHPAPGERGVPYGRLDGDRANNKGRIAALMDHEIDSHAVRDAFALFDADGNRVAAHYSASYSGLPNIGGRRHMFLVPDQSLLPDHQYTVVISTVMRDVEGRHLAKPYTWTFTTAEAK